MKPSHIAAVVGSFLAATSLVACGSTPTSSQTIKTTAFTPLTQANFGTAVAAQVKGAKSVHMTMTSSLLSANADFSYGPPLAMQMTMRVTTQGQAANMQMRLVGTVMYMQIAGRTPAGKFMSMDLAKFPATFPIFKVLAQYKNLGPGSMTSQFKKGVKSLKYMGTAQVDGQLARHYTLTVDPAAVLQALGNNAALAGYASQLVTMTEQVYLDENRRPLRIVMALPAPVGSMQIDFSNWGESVQVLAPPASQVIPILLSALHIAG